MTPCLPNRRITRGNSAAVVPPRRRFFFVVLREGGVQVGSHGKEERSKAVATSVPFFPRDAVPGGVGQLRGCVGRRLQSARPSRYRRPLAVVVRGGVAHPWTRRTRTGRCHLAHVGTNLALSRRGLGTPGGAEEDRIRRASRALPPVGREGPALHRRGARWRGRSASRWAWRAARMVATRRRSRSPGG